MKIEVLLFAGAKEAAGRESVTVDLPVSTCVGELRAELLKAAPALGQLPPLLLAVNNSFASDDAVLQYSDEVACFPPVSGG